MFWHRQNIDEQKKQEKRQKSTKNSEGPKKYQNGITTRTAACGFQTPGTKQAYSSLRCCHRPRSFLRSDGFPAFSDARLLLNPVYKFQGGFFYILIAINYPFYHFLNPFFARANTTMASSYPSKDDAASGFGEVGWDITLGPRRNLKALFTNSHRLSTSSLTDVRTGFSKAPGGYAASFTSNDSFCRDVEMGAPESMSSLDSLAVFDTQYQAHRNHTPVNTPRKASQPPANNPDHCGQCIRNDGPIARCIDCATLLCDHCASIHCDLRMFMGHHIVGIELDVPDTCDLHLLAPLTAACFTCRTKLCNECLRNHSSCQTISLKVMEATCFEAYQSIVNKVEAELATTDQQLRENEHQYGRALMWKERANAALQSLEVAYLEQVKATFMKAYAYVEEHSMAPEYAAEALTAHKVRTQQILEKSEPLIASINKTSVFDDYEKHNAFGRDVEALFQHRPLIPSMHDLDDEFAPPMLNVANTMYKATGYNIFRQIANDMNESSNGTFAKKRLTFEYGFGQCGAKIGEFLEPAGITVSSDGYVAITDTKNNRIQIFDNTGALTSFFGTPGVEIGQMLYPNCIAVCPKNDYYVIAERNPVHQIQIYTRDGRFIRRFGQTVIQNPRGLAVDKNGNIIVVECKVMRITLFDQFGNVLNSFYATGILEFPMGVCVNDKREIFIVDNRQHCIHVFNYDGQHLRKMCDNGIIRYPISINMNNTGEIVVTDNHRAFNMTFFSQKGELIRAFESRNRHILCITATVSGDNKIYLVAKECRVFAYNCNVGLM
uniref:B box-type domain-containing protein n=1 Tax=Panagrellus redivivus TaxID=6233 RepID=A0A7E4ZTZ8_PANRE